MNKKHYFFITVFSYLLFLLATIPVGTVVKTINSNTSIDVRGASGTIWSGQAISISINKTIHLDNTEWSFSAWKLLIGHATFQISSHYDNKTIKGEIGSSFLGQYFIDDFTAKMAAGKLAELANIPLVQLSGEITFNIDHAHWKKDTLPLAIGTITWDSATITVADTVSLGKITIALSENDEQLLNAEINSKGGDILVNGNAALIPEANYTADIKLSPTSSANGNIKNSLALFAKKQKNGDFLLKKTGQLNQLGL